jgi:hypothetical protein
MRSVIEELRREAAARADADRLRSRIEELSEEPARAEEQASRLVIAREEVTRVWRSLPPGNRLPVRTERRRGRRGTSPRGPGR